VAFRKIENELIPNNADVTKNMSPKKISTNSYRNSDKNTYNYQSFKNTIKIKHVRIHFVDPGKLKMKFEMF